MQVVDVNGNMFGYDHLEIIGADGRPKTLDSGLTSVGLSMPSAFSVSNSPLTSNGTIGVTGAGTNSQYIDGTGALRTFPSLTGYVTAVTASAPLSSSGGTTPNISLLRANTTTDGYLSAIDWNTFNNKQPAGNYITTSRTLTINGTAYDLSADRSWSVGTVTSVAMTVPTGLTVAGSPITGAGTFALSLQSGYSIPTTANQSNWTTAYNRSLTAFSINYGAFSTNLILTEQDSSTLSLSLIAGAAAQGKIVFFNGSNLAYTSLNASAPLSLDPNNFTFSISQATTSTNGYLSSTDWNTFNNKQNAITLTTTGSSGAATLIGSTLNIPNYSSALSGYVPTSRQLTINGTSYDLSADRSWSVGTVTSVATTGPITGGTITGSGTIGITQATTSTDGYLSSTDWNTFNDKQEEITLTTTGTSGPATFTSDSLNIPDYSSAPRGNFAQTAKSVPVTNTTEAQSLIYVNFERRVDNDGGVTESLDCMESELRNYGSVGSLSVPANSFRVGDSFHVNLSGYISSQNNQDIEIRVMANGGATVLALASTTLDTATNKFFDLVITFTIRAIGSAGVAKIATSGQFTYSKDASNAFEGTDFIYINEDTFDTTIYNTLDITAQWENASTSNSIHSEIFTLQKIY
jgi:predicted heme/steroid binding protein